MSENKIKELEDEIQSLHDSIEEKEANLQIKREELKNLNDPKWEEKEEQKKIKIFLKNAEVNLDKWQIVEEKYLKNAYIEDSHVMAISAKSKIDLSNYQKICFPSHIIHRLLGYYLKNSPNNTMKLYFNTPDNPLIFHDGKIWSYTTYLIDEDEDEEFEEPKEVGSKKKTAIEKIIELQELIDKAKNLIFAAQDIDLTIDYPYCREIEIGKPNASMGKQLAEIRSTLEWMDNMCWAYRG